MGDRCYVEVTFSQTDIDTVCRALLGMDDSDKLTAVSPEDVFSQSAYNDTDNTVCGSIEEANYGMHEEWEALAQQGVQFCGFHHAGGSYDGMEFCSDGTQLFTVPIDGGGYKVVQIDDSTGLPNQRDLEAVADYLFIYKEVHKYFKSITP